MARSVRPRALAAATATAALLALLGACSSGGAPRTPTGRSAAQGFTVALLLPETTTPRYERTDKPAFEAELARTCAKCRVAYANAGGSAATQLAEAQAVLTDGAGAIVLDPVDPAAAGAVTAAAKAKGVPVVSYDHLAEGPVAGYVTFTGDAPDRDAQLTQLRDVLAGTAPEAAYRSYGLQAQYAADMAVAYAQGLPYRKALTTTRGTAGEVPTVALAPETVTRGQLKDVVGDGLFSAADLCAGDTAAACRSAGLAT